MGLARTLHLVAPGLLGPWSRREAMPRPATPALERLLARARTRSASPGPDATLFDLFGVAGTPGADLPVAAVTRQADGAPAGDAFWLRADPVHLRADLHQVLLADARSLDLGAEEAAVLVAEINTVFEADGWTLEAPTPRRWYLRLEDDPGLRTHPPELALGRDVGPLLPAGPGARRWRTLLTEVQMLLHGSAVNVQRESRGLPSVNSLWFWGGGRLPAGARPPAPRVFADDLLTQGLLLLTGAHAEALPGDAHAWERAVGQADALIVLETARLDAADGDTGAWCRHLETLERDWFAPLLAQVRRGRLERLIVHPCAGAAYALTRRDLARVWRRTRGLDALVLH